MRRILAAMALALMLPACALASQIAVTQMEDAQSGSTLAAFSVEADVVDTVPGQETEPDAAQLAVSALIEARFQQQKALTAVNRGTVTQTSSVWQDGKVASMALMWRGEQADGTDGCRATGLNVNLETGEEILLEQLFENWDGALAAMETIITDDVLEEMSDYMEYSELLPMPTDNYSFDEHGLTVYWPEERYRYFDETCGSVTFYWYELEAYIGEESPVYAVSRSDDADVQKLRDALNRGTLSEWLDDCRVGDKLGNAMDAYQLADPDYTTDALVYPFERVRGYALEIPKYAETDEEDTPISAVRASRISYGGLTTGRTVKEDLFAIFGEPDSTKAYDEDAAFDALLEPGESLFYTQEGNVLQAHFDEDGVLSCLIIRDALPETLY